MNKIKKSQSGNFQEEENYIESKLTEGKDKKKKDYTHHSKSESSDSKEDETYHPENESFDDEEDVNTTRSEGFYGLNTDLLCKSQALGDFSDSWFRFSLKQKLLLEEQMRMHVQLTAQSFLLTFESSKNNKHNLLRKLSKRMTNIEKILTSARANLKELSTRPSLCKYQQKSCFKSCNIEDAMDIIRYFNQKKPNEETSLMARRVLCESKVFMYPDLCPEELFSSPKCVDSKLEFHEAEDHLIAMGLETFGDYEMPLKGNMIKKYFLPCRTSPEIRNQIVYHQRHNILDSPIQHVQDCGKVPEFPIEIRGFVESDIKAPVEQYVKLLPKWMVPFAEIFERNGPFPYFMELSCGVISDNFIIPEEKPPCAASENFELSDEKAYLINSLIDENQPTQSVTSEEIYEKEQQYIYTDKTPVYGIHSKIDLCQDLIDPTSVNCSLTDLPSDIDILMTDGIKLSSLKRTKSIPTTCNPKRLRESAGSSDLSIPGLNKKTKLETNSGNAKFLVLNKSDSSSSVMSQQQIPMSSKKVLVCNVTKIAAPSTSSKIPNVNLIRSTNAKKSVYITIENENDSSSMENTAMAESGIKHHNAQKDTHPTAFDFELASNIKEEPI